MKANMSAKWCKINKPPCATSFPPSLSIKKKGRASSKLLTGELCRKIGHFGNGE